MIQRKICMLGSFAVGKTSMVRRFVHSIFAEKYLSTVGVKIDKKLIQASGQELMLMLWDLYGEDGFQKVQLNYLRGSSGFLVIVDGTRLSTLTTGLSLCQTVLAATGPIPYLVVLNKSDLRAEWEVTPQHLAELQRSGVAVRLASAKSGEGVESAFVELSELMLRSSAS